MLTNEYTEECLQKLGKPHLIAMVLSQRDETKATIESLTYEVKKLNANFKKLETILSIVKTVNNLLVKKSVDIERQFWKNAQCSRRESLYLYFPCQTLLWYRKIVLTESNLLFHINLFILFIICSKQQLNLFNKRALFFFLRICT